ncbi:helix-turn-helix domain-containing protein [Deinococcus sp.]|uniref:helix-turn-helix domain-containing protein n=1 Tax=Deinococcus sp. TaxID=47478 RepID=UPI003C7CD814
MIRRAPTLSEVTLQDGARLFVAAHALSDSQVAEVHRYTFYGLAWLSGGAATFVCDAVRYQVAPGSLVCTAPGQVNWWEGEDPGAQLTLLGFVPDVFTGGALDVRLLTDLPLFRPDAVTVLPAPGEAGTALDTLFGQVWRRYLQSAQPGPNMTWQVLPRQREGLLLAYLHAILAEAATLDLDASDASAPALSLGQSADLRLTRLFRLHSVGHALQRRPVGYYAELLHVTPDHLARVVGRVTGRTPGAWLQERLLIEAVRMLSFTTRPIEQIAQDLHFPTATQFSQWFRKRSGQTPSQIRHGHTSEIQQS